MLIIGRILYVVGLMVLLVFALNANGDRFPYVFMVYLGSIVGVVIMILETKKQLKKEEQGLLVKGVTPEDITKEGSSFFEAKILITYERGELNSVKLLSGTTQKKNSLTSHF